jgi:hypothetical protein
VLYWKKVILMLCCYCAGINADSYCNQQKFMEKLQAPAPAWVTQQIEEDLGAFKESGVSLLAINKTFHNCASKIMCHLGYPFRNDLFAHYRIIDNQIYRKYNGCTYVYFDEALIKLSQLIHLPNVEFILDLQDGVPQADDAPDFWITENRSNQAPIFARAKKNQTKYIALFPDYSAFGNQLVDIKSVIAEVLKGSEEYPWELKIKKAFWRGASSDIGKYKCNELSIEEIKSMYSTKPRYLLCQNSLIYPDLIDAGFTATYQNLELFLRKQGMMQEHCSVFNHIQYAYLPCLDGWSCTYPGYYWRLLSNSVVLKAESDQILWFYGALKEYEHYIPVHYNCSDICEKILWAQNHEGQCRLISEKARRLVLEELSVEDNYLYVWRILKYYETLQQFDCRLLLNETLRDPVWIKCK